MTPQPQDQEYIITREELERVEVACINEYGDWLGHTNDVLFETIRSRPHTSAPKFAKDCMCNKYANCTDCQQHDTAIRNVTLDGIIKAINEDIEYEDYCIKTFDTRINRTQKAILSQVVEKIESLRGEP